MTNNISTTAMLEYLQELLTQFQEEAKEYGNEDRHVRRLFDSMIACKEMTEALIGEPINLRKDGKVTIG